MGIIPKVRRSPYRKKNSLEKKRGKTIGIAGSGPSVGVTHFAVLTANYLGSVLYQKTAVLEWNQSGAFADLEAVSRRRAAACPSSNTFELMGVTYCKAAGKKELLDLANGRADVIVIDFGTLCEANQEEFLRCDRKFLIGSASAWQLRRLTDLLSTDRISRDGWELFYSFGDHETIRMTERYLKVSFRHIPLSQDACSINGELLAFFGKFLK